MGMIGLTMLRPTIKNVSPGAKVEIPPNSEKIEPAGGVCVTPLFVGYILEVGKPIMSSRSLFFVLCQLVVDIKRRLDVLEALLFFRVEASARAWLGLESLADAMSYNDRQQLN